jgi:hypothetical protein
MNNPGVVGGGNLGEQLKATAALARLNTIEVKAASFNGTGVDRQGYNSGVFAISSGAATAAGAFSAKLQHSTDNAVFVDVAAGNIGWGDFATAASALLANSAAVLKCDFRNLNRYVRLAFTKDAGTDLILAHGVTLGAAESLPAA